MKADEARRRVYKQQADEEAKRVRKPVPKQIRINVTLTVAGDCRVFETTFIRVVPKAIEALLRTMQAAFPITKIAVQATHDQEHARYSARHTLKQNPQVGKEKS